MGEEILMFGKIQIEKKKYFYYHKIPTLLGDVDIQKVLVSDKISFDEKTVNALLLTL